MRREIVVRLREVATPESDIDAASIILSELLSNVEKHAPPMAEICIEWTLAAPVLLVADRGAGFDFSPSLPHASSESGRGLYLVAALAEAVDVAYANGGTQISVRLPLRRMSHVPPIAHVHEGLGVRA